MAHANSIAQAAAQRAGIIRRAIMPISVLALGGAALVLVGAVLCRPLSDSIQTPTEYQIRRLSEALETMRRDIGRYPTAEEGLTLLVTPPEDRVLAANWHGPYISDSVLKDPWGQPYHYNPAGRRPNRFALYSDGQPGSTPAKAIGFPPAD